MPFEPIQHGRITNVQGSTRINPRHAQFIREQEQLTLQGIRDDQRRRREGFDLFRQLLGGFLPGEDGGIGQPGGPEFGLGQPGGPDSEFGFEGNPFAEGIANIESSRQAEIERGFKERSGSLLARLEDRGLGTSSFARNTELGTERERQDALSGLSGDVGRLQIAGVQAGFEQQRSQRTQQLQEFQTLAQLLGGFF